MAIRKGLRSPQSSPWLYAGLMVPHWGFVFFYLVVHQGVFRPGFLIVYLLGGAAISASLANSAVAKGRTRGDARMLAALTFIGGGPLVLVGLKLRH